MVLEFQGAQRVGDALDRVGLAVREIIARIDAPFVAGARVCRVQDAVQHRVAQVDVAGSHVDLGAQHPRAVRELAGAHAAKQVEVLVDAAPAVRAVAAGLGQAAAHRAHFLGRQVVDIGFAGADQMFGPVVEPLEIVGRVVEVRPPVKAEPAHVALDRVDVFLLFAGRVGVVKAQMAAPAIFLRHAKIEAYRLGMADMEIAVGLGWKPGHDLARPPGVEVGLDDVADKVAPGHARLAPSRLARSRLACHRSPRFGSSVNVADPLAIAKPAADFAPGRSKLSPGADRRRPGATAFRARKTRSGRTSLPAAARRAGC